MSTESTRPTPRREFLGHLATSAVALASTACVANATAAAAVAPAPQSRPGAGESAPAPATRVQWDDSWVTRLTAKHKALFEAATVEEGVVLGHAVRYLTGIKEVLDPPDSDVQVVLVLRHSAIPMAFNDAMWAKYKIGKEAKIKDGNDWATRNPYLNSTRGAGRGDRPSATLAWFASHGHIMLGCNMATLGWAGGFAQSAGVDSKTVYEDLKANLVPGMILLPNGIYAVHRAQEAGCTFFKSS